jgi:hypothetical protein
VHPLRQPSFRFVERLGSPDRLAACPTRFACSGPPFSAEFQFKFGQACENTGHNPSGGVRPVPDLLDANESTSTFETLATVGRMGELQVITALEQLGG